MLCSSSWRRTCTRYVHDAAGQRQDRMRSDRGRAIEGVAKGRSQGRKKVEGGCWWMHGVEQEVWSRVGSSRLRKSLFAGAWCMGLEGWFAARGIATSWSLHHRSSWPWASVQVLG